MGSEILNELVAELRCHGVTEYTLDRGGKHPKLRFVYAGKPLMLVYPCSPGDHRCVKNAIATLRGVMGVKRIITKPERPAKPPKRRHTPALRRQRLPSLSAPPPASADPWAPLAALRERMAMTTCGP